MKINILSDTHNELQSGLAQSRGNYDERVWEGGIPMTDADIIVLAGDIHAGSKGVEWAINESEALNKPIIYVAGNHEYYNREYHSTLKQMREVAQGTNVHFLECDEIIINDVRFLGTTLWTDYDAVEGISRYDAMNVCQDTLNDHQLIRISPDGLFTPRHAFKLHAQSVKWLRDKLNVSSVTQNKTVVVTHHGPSKACQHKKYPINSTSAAFLSDLDDLVGKADVWISGHSHSNLDTIVKGCRLVSNQPGYPEEEVEGFDASLIIEV